MLSNNKMVKARRAFESIYDSLCTVTVFEKYEKENGTTGFREAVTIENEPCKLQFKTSAAQLGDAASSVSQEIRLFMRPEPNIPAGSRIIVDSVEYKHSGVADRYHTHQEIVLLLADRWS